MSKNIAVLLIGILLTALPVIAIVKGNLFSIEANQNFEKCSSRIEGLKLCADNPTIAVNSDEPIRIKLSWVNSSNEERKIMRAGYYFVKITDEQEKPLERVFQQKIKNHSMTKDDWATKLARNSYTSIFLDAHETRNDEIRLTENYAYDFDLTKKGRYKLTISKTIPSLEKGKTIEFVIDDVEIEVK